MQVRLPAKPRRFLNLAPADAMPLIRSLQNLPRRSFRGSAPLGELFEDIYRMYCDRDRPFRTLSLASRVLEFLIAIVEHARADVARRASADNERAIAFIRDRPELPLDIAELAAQSGLSASRFKAKFREQTGMPPGEYALRHKVERARSMLAAGKTSVTAVAYDLGFSSSQYFSTVFRRFTQQRPSDLRPLRK
jgi:AraC-like DNA-binding protein